MFLSLTSALTAADRAKLVLHVDGSSGTFAVSDATAPSASFTYEWTGTGLDWSSETSVTLRLRDGSNTAPVFADASATREVPENSGPGTDVGAVVTATDADSDTLTYSLEGTDAASFAIDSGTGQIKTVTGVTYDHEATQNSYAVTVKADDGNGGSDTIDVAITLLDDDTEKSATPAKPALAPVAGSSTSLTATWTKPGLNGGPEITGYKVQYRQGSGNWQNFPHGDTALTTTITGLMAETEYQVRVQAENGEGDSDWSEPSDAVTPTEVTGLPPGDTTVVVASAPQSGDTYRLYETILFTVTFSEPVRVTPGRLRLKVGLDNPGGASGSTVEAVFSGLSQSQRPTADTPQARRARHMHFEYKVQLFDRDANGVSIRANALRLGSGARIRTEDGVDAELDHAAVGPLSDHKVDGSADVPMIERIEVVSTPRLWSRGAREADTYGEGENIRIEVQFDQPVHVEGEPTMALEVGNPCESVCEARYESGSGTDTLVFAYLVLANEIDRNGIAIPADPIEVVYGDSIRNDADQEAHLSFRREGTQRDHKVDGSRTAAPHLSVEDAEAHEADGEMAFTVRLEPHGLGIVTVDYETRDGSAQAGEDYTETSGTLRFNPLETERTVTVPIIDDAHEDDGETFTLRLSNADGARLRDGDRAARGTIRNSDPKALSASFPASAFASASHSGADDRPQAVVAFSEAVAAFAADTPSVSVTGGRVASVQPHAEDGLENAWVFFLVPDGDGDVTFALVADAACAAGGICTAGGTALAEVPAAATIPGPGGPAEPEGPPLTATFEDVPEAHDGESAFRFRVAFSEPIAISFRSLREDAFETTGGRVTRGTRVDGRKDLFEITVEPDGDGELTIALPAGRDCAVSGAICTWGPPRKRLTNTPTATVAGPAAAPLTASFEGVPSAHDGQTAFHAQDGVQRPAQHDERPAVAGGRRGGDRGPGDGGRAGEPAQGPVAADGRAGLAGGRDGDGRGRGGLRHSGGGLHVGRPGAVEHHLGDGAGAGGHRGGGCARGGGRLRGAGLRGDAQPRGEPRVDGGLRHVGRQRAGGRRLHGGERDADVPGGRIVADDRGRGARRRA